MPRRDTGTETLRSRRRRDSDEEEEEAPSAARNKRRQTRRKKRQELHFNATTFQRKKTRRRVGAKAAGRREAERIRGVPERRNNGARRTRRQKLEDKIREEQESARFPLPGDLEGV
ncbi:UNVERIFIED_CONTAM: hypothetical protein HHA_452140 [Hammondia hammondi]|eukprot:XP_008885194.1 hypothetical protein HHA_452140 [Hammondia hammondi]